jgi:hypothetical protein
VLARHDQLRARVLQRLARVRPPRRHARDRVLVAAPMGALELLGLPVKVVK